MKIRLEELGVGVDSETAKEYEDMKTRDEFLAGEIADLERSAAQLRQLIVDLESELHGRFTEGLQKINSEFERLFTIMFGGGSARLTLISPQPRAQADADAEMSDDATESRAAHSHAEQTQIGAEADDDSGIEIDVSLPNKRVKGLQMLSGGERALTSIALIFAMSQINPPLFIILDETDAALDEANSRRYGDMIEELAKKSQLILITHNRETMSRAGVLYGVTMGGDGISRLLSVKFDEAVQVAK
jgi:chromosome segregation protein